MKNKEILNRVHDFLGKVVRDCPDQDMGLEASDLADDVWGLLHQFDVIHVEAGVRYAEDAKVDDHEESEETPKMPCLSKREDGWLWNLDIDVNTGRILNWTQGVTAKTWYKVCDECRINAGNKTYYEYVPDFLSPAERGYGDYMHMNIAQDGTIKNWNAEACREFIEETMKE